MSNLEREFQIEIETRAEAYFEQKAVDEYDGQQEHLAEIAYQDAQAEAAYELLMQNKVKEDPETQDKIYTALGF